MKLPLIEFSSKQFTLSADGKTLISEASDMENRHLQPLYNDACDRGFAVKSERTGNVVVFVLSDTELFPDDGICSWKFTPTTESVRQHPECRGMSATIFND